MRPLDFISLNIQCGQKVRLTLCYHNETKTIECYFKGFRNRYGSRVAKGLDDILPVFCKVAANGSMNRKEVNEYTAWDFIAEVEPVDQTVSLLGPDDAKDALSVQLNQITLECRTIGQIILEMAQLFPGKRIPFHKGFPARFPGLACIINDIGLDANGNLSSGIISEGGYEVVPGLHQASSPAALLSSLYEAILFPPEGVPDDIPNLLRLRTLSWKDIPSAGPDTPLLDDCQILERLRATLWWTSLTVEGKRGAINLDDERAVEERQRRHIADDIPDAQFLDILWREFPPVIQVHLLSEAQRAAQQTN